MVDDTQNEQCQWLSECTYTSDPLHVYADVINLDASIEINDMTWYSEHSTLSDDMPIC